MIKEFKEFISRGNVIDLAVGVIIGAAFGKIISSVVDDILMPLIGILTGGINFKDFKLTLKDAVLDANGHVIQNAVNLNFGNFIQVAIDFLIIAFVLFIIIKAVNKFRRKEDEKPTPPNEPSEEIILLREIRDSLKK
ncbi:MAG TPA: large-conductance mechanosensitive channel protein MscL [Ignavibacteria bacterium]|nr:large-conductance mechanosensitive channel protein MscL [Ignavibacteria bacterium]